MPAIGRRIELARREPLQMAGPFQVARIHRPLNRQDSRPIRFGPFSNHTAQFCTAIRAPPPLTTSTFGRILFPSIVDGERMRLWNRLRCWLLRSRLERDLAEEMRLHRETLEDRFVREGMSRSDARLAAARQFGAATAAAEESRETWGFVWLDNILKDLRFAWRLMIRQPAMTAAAALTVAFGVGANTAIVSVLETALLNPLGLRHADKVMVARVRLDAIQMRHAPVSGVELREVQSMTD